MNKSVVVGTAGHIDHGKSSLIEALTGTHPDRLKEEQERGITIDLGFASLRLDEQTEVGFVDVPGHERFIKNMLAGAGGIDAVILVVAADESIKPQTREHLEICRLLNVRTGVVAITKTDLVDPDSLEVVKLEVQEFVSGTFLDGVPVIPVSVKSGLGLSELRSALLVVSHRSHNRDDLGAIRMPIDRCFSLRGFGTVVTGTLLSGTLNVEDEVQIYPLGPHVRVRGIQVHSIKVDRARAGQRTAINLAGIEVQEIARGMEIASGGRFQPVTKIDAQFELSKSAPISISRKTQVRFHLGTAELVASIRPVENKELRPGESGFVHLHLSGAALALPGDRFVVRRLSPMMTLGGGQVLDTTPPRSKYKGQVAFLSSIQTTGTEDFLTALAQRKGLSGLHESEMLSLCSIDAGKLRRIVERLVERRRLESIVEDPCLVADPGSFALLLKQIPSELDRFHTQNPLATGMPREQLLSGPYRNCQPLIFRAAVRHLTELRQVEIHDDLIGLTGRTVRLTSKESDVKKQIEQVYLEAGLQVPTTDEFLATLGIPKDQARKILSLLIRENRLVKVSENLIFHSDSIHKILSCLAEIKKKSTRLDVTSFKTLTGVSRKYAIPLLEYLDRQRATRRIGDERIIL